MHPECRADDPAELVDAKLLCERLSEVLKSLTLREQLVIELRFGLRDGIPRTTDEIGVELSVTSERVRQISDRALEKLRNPEVARQLADFVG